MSIIYLAGEDSAPEDGEHLPPHKSRFWAYPGSEYDHRCLTGRYRKRVALGKGE